MTAADAIRPTISAILLAAVIAAPAFAQGKTGAAAPPPSPAPVEAASEAPIAVRFTLDWKIEGPAAPFLVALDKGYFKAQGLEVTIEPGAGSVETPARLASGAYDMGFGDINTLIKTRDANAETSVQAVFMLYNKPPYAIVGRKSRGIGKPKDLEGRKLGAPSLDASFAQWKTFARINDIDAAKVNVENIGFAVREPMLAAGQVDAATGFSFSTFLDLKERGVPVEDIALFVMADLGLSLYGNAILVNPKFATEHPDAVRKFLTAFLKGLRDTIKNPDLAIESVLKRNDGARKTVELERLNMALKDNILTAEVKVNGFGAVDMKRLAHAIEQIALGYDFKGDKPAPADIFNAAFLPPPAERKM